MIEILKKYAESKEVGAFCKNCGFSIHFESFDKLIDSLKKLKDLAHSRLTSKNNQSMY